MIVWSSIMRHSGTGLVILIAIIFMSDDNVRPHRVRIVPEMLGVNNIEGTLGSIIWFFVFVALHPLQKIKLSLDILRAYQNHCRTLPIIVSKDSLEKLFAKTSKYSYVPKIFLS